MEYILVACLFLMAIGVNLLLYYWLYFCVKALFSDNTDRTEFLFNLFYVPITLGLSVGCTALIVAFAQAIH